MSTTSVEVDGLIRRLEPLLGATVQRAAMSVWPFEGEHLAETGVELNLDMTLRSGQRTSVTFRTMADGFTPSVIDEVVHPDFSWNSIDDRMRFWKENLSTTSPESLRHEVFDLSDAPDYSGIIGSGIEGFSIMCFHGRKKHILPTGLQIEFSSGITVFSTASGDFNYVSTDPRDHQFWFETFDIPVRSDSEQSSDRESAPRRVGEASTRGDTPTIRDRIEKGVRLLFLRKK